MSLDSSPASNISIPFAIKNKQGSLAPRRSKNTITSIVEERTINSSSNSNSPKPQRDRPPELQIETRNLQISNSILDSSNRSNGLVLENEFLVTMKLTQFLPILQNELMLEKVGRPLNFAISSNIAIGTNLGKILIIDLEGNMLAILGKQASYFGLVSSLQFSIDGSRIVVGYSEGYVTVWSWESATLEATIEPSTRGKPQETDAAISHLVGIPITHVSFVSRSRHRFISGDVKGNILHHQIISNVVLSRVKSQVLVTAPNQNSNNVHENRLLLDVEALPRGTVSSQVDKLGIISILFNDRFMIIQTQPEIKTIFQKLHKHNITNNKEVGLGSIAWMPSNAIYRAQTYCTVLYSVGNSVTAYFLDDSNLNNRPNGLSAKLFFKWQAVSGISSVQWINPITFFIVTNNNVLFAVDICNKVESRVFEFDSISPLSQPWLAVETGLNIFGTVRYSSVMYKNLQYVLTKSNIYTLNLRSWQERVLWLMDEGRFIEAIALCTGLYKGSSGQAVFGLPPTSTSLLSLPNIKPLPSGTETAIANLDLQRELSVGPKLTTLVQASIKFLFSAKYEENSLSQMQQNGFSERVSRPFALLKKVYGTMSINGILASLLLVTIEACIATNKLDFLFKDIFEQICIDPDAELIFLDTLEPFIENGIISYVSPQVLQSLVKSYSENASTRKKLEECLIYVNLEPQGGVMTFDIDGILSTCLTWRMWKASCRIWMDVLHDAVTPLSQILDHVTLVLHNRILHSGVSSIDDDNWYQEENLIEEFRVYFVALEASLCGNLYPGNYPRAPISLSQTICVNTLGWMLNPTIPGVKTPQTPNKQSSNRSDAFDAPLNDFESQNNSNPRLYNSFESFKYLDPYQEPENSSQTSKISKIDHLYSNNGSEHYNILKISLAFNTRQTLSVLTNTMDSEFIQQIVLVMQQSNPALRDGFVNNQHDSRFIKNAKKVKSAAQATCDSLLDFLRIHSGNFFSDNFEVTNMSSESAYDRSTMIGKEKLGLVACFLTQTFVSKYPLVYFADGTDNFLTRVLLHANTTKTLQECELALENLLKICSPYSNIQDLIELVKQAGFFRVLGVLYKSTYQFSLVIQSYLDDPNLNRKKLVFNEISRLCSLGDEDDTPDIKTDLTNFLANNLDKLCAIDSVGLAMLAENCVVEGISHMTITSAFFENLNGSEVEFKYLDTIFNIKKYLPSDRPLNSTEGTGLGDEPPEQYFEKELESGEIMIKYGKYSVKTSSIGILSGLNNLHLDQLRGITERYISLLIQFNPDQVLDFLKTHKADNINKNIFRVEAVKELCKNSGLTSVVIWLCLLENKHSDALKIYLQQLENIVMIEESKPLYTIPAESMIPHSYDMSNSERRLPSLTEELSGDISTELPLTISENDYMSKALFTAYTSQVDIRIKEITDGCLHICSSLAAHLKSKEQIIKSASNTITTSSTRKEIEESWMLVVSTYMNQLTIYLNANFDSYLDSPNGVKSKSKSFEPMHKLLQRMLKGDIFSSICASVCKILDYILQSSLKLGITLQVPDMIFKILFTDPHHDNSQRLEEAKLRQLLLQLLLLLFGFKKTFNDNRSALTMVTRMLDTDLFVLVSKSVVLAKRGWRMTSTGDSTWVKPIYLLSSYNNGIPEPTEANSNNPLILLNNRENAIIKTNFQDEGLTVKWRCGVCSGSLFVDDRQSSALDKLSDTSKAYFKPISREIVKTTTSGNLGMKQLWSILRETSQAHRHGLYPSSFNKEQQGAIKYPRMTKKYVGSKNGFIGRSNDDLVKSNSSKLLGSGNILKIEEKASSMPLSSSGSELKPRNVKGLATKNISIPLRNSVLFGCGHGFHTDCISDKMKEIQGKSKGEHMRKKYICLQCK